MSTTVSPAPADCWYALALLLRGRTSALPPACPRRPGRALPDDGRRRPSRWRTAARTVPTRSRAGTLDGDLVRCGLCGFAYDTDGQCVSRPDPAAGALRRPRRGVPGPGARRPGLGLARRVGSGAPAPGPRAAVADRRRLGRRSVAPRRWPPASCCCTRTSPTSPRCRSWRRRSRPPPWPASTPPLEVVVTETTVELRREFPPAPLPGWQTEMLGAEVGAATHGAGRLLPVARGLGRPLGRDVRRRGRRGCGSPSS